MVTSGSQRQEKTDSLKEMKSTLKAVEKEWRMLFNEELENLELDLCVMIERGNPFFVVIRITSQASNLEECSMF